MLMPLAVLHHWVIDSGVSLHEVQPCVALVARVCWTHVSLVLYREDVFVLSVPFGYPKPSFSIDLFLSLISVSEGILKLHQNKGSGRREYLGPAHCL